MTLSEYLISPSPGGDRTGTAMLVIHVSPIDFGGDSGNLGFGQAVDPSLLLPNVGPAHEATHEKDRNGKRQCIEEQMPGDGPNAKHRAGILLNEPSSTGRGLQREHWRPI